MQIAYLGIGTNLENKQENVEKAIFLLEKRVGKCLAKSKNYFSAAWGFVSDNEFLNIAIKMETALSPFDLLRETQNIEREMGRTEKSTDGAYHDRIIDIDILLYGDEKIDTPELKIPHPHIAERDFVSVPLKEIIVLPL
jgi:2-amino-4-hydroxy-6-hydroxymethyldihydropteridine diphosphokinase